jgi:hypothetical protein
VRLTQAEPDAEAGRSESFRTRRLATADWVVDRIRASGEFAQTVEAELVRLHAWASMR